MTSGNVTDSYAYDAFGAMAQHTGTNPQRFGYAGQQQDVAAEGGLVYLRAREYDPALGRFLTEDPLPFAVRFADKRGNRWSANAGFGARSERSFAALKDDNCRGFGTRSGRSRQ